MHWHARSVHGIQTFWKRAVWGGWLFGVPRVRDFPSVSLLRRVTLDLPRFTHRFLDRPRMLDLDSIVSFHVTRSQLRARGLWSPSSCLSPSWLHPFRRAHLVALEDVGGEGSHLSRQLQIGSLLGGSNATRIGARVCSEGAHQDHLYVPTCS